MRLVLNNVRLSFPDIFQAKSFQGQPPVFGATFIFGDTQNHEKAKKALKEVALSTWGQKGESVLQALERADKTCLHDGANKSNLDGFEGNFYINAKSRARPLVVDRDKTPLAEEDGKPYAGCYVNASLEIWGMDNQYGKRICATLKGIQFVKDGEAFGASSASAENDFEPLDGEDDNGIGEFL